MVNKSEELSLNWHNFKYTIINSEGKAVEIEFTGSELDIKYIKNNYYIQCSKLKLAILDKDLNLVWENTEVNIKITGDTV